MSFVIVYTEEPLKEQLPYILVIAALYIVGTHDIRCHIVFDPSIPLRSWTASDTVNSIWDSMYTILDFGWTAESTVTVCLSDIRISYHWNLQYPSLQCILARLFHYTIGQCRILSIPFEIAFTPFWALGEPLKAQLPCLLVISALYIVEIRNFRRHIVFWPVLNRLESVEYHATKSISHTTAWHLPAKEPWQLINWTYLSLLTTARCVWHVHSKFVWWMYSNLLCTDRNASDTMVSISFTYLVWHMKNSCR